MVRETTRNDENQTVLSVCWGGHKHFIVQTTSEVSDNLQRVNRTAVTFRLCSAQGEFRFEGPSFPTIQELITYQYQCALPVTSRSGAILRQPIPRERWELNNDDVLLLEKIGRVRPTTVRWSPAAVVGILPFDRFRAISATSTRRGCGRPTKR